MKRYVKANDSSQHYVIDIVATFEFREEKVAAFTNYVVHTKKRGSKFTLTDDILNKMDIVVGDVVNNIYQFKNLELIESKTYQSKKSEAWYVTFKLANNSTVTFRFRYAVHDTKHEFAMTPDNGRMYLRDFNVGGIQVKSGYDAFLAYIVDNIYKPLNEGDIECMQNIANHTKAYTDDTGMLNIEGE